MKCHEAKHHLDPFMDGELSVPENLKVLEHLNLCRACAGVYEGEKALRGALRTRLGSERAPSGLADRLARFVDAPPAAAALPRRRWLSIAAAAAFFLATFAVVGTSRNEQPQAVAQAAVTMHQETRKGFCGMDRDDCVCLCGKCAKDIEGTMSEFFHRHVPFDVCAHELEGLGYRPYGASVWFHHATPVCWTVFRGAQGRTITHGLITARLRMDPHPLYLGGDRPVVLVPAGDSGMTCVFTFDDEGEAQRFRELMHLK